MKRRNIFTLLTILLAILFCLEYAAGQKGPIVTINNLSAQRRVVCVDTDSGGAPGTSGKRCITIRSGHYKEWYRNGVRTSFTIKMYRPTLASISHRLPGNTSRIDLYASRIGYVQTPGAKNYRLKICNAQWDREIYVALAFETKETYLIEGWWGIQKGKCFEIGVSDRLKELLNLGYSTLPKIYYSAEMHSMVPRFWPSARTGPAFCVEDKKLFETKLARNKPRPTECSNGQRLAGFAAMTPPKPNDLFFRKSF